MIISKDILEFIDAQSDLYLGYNEIVFFKSGTIAEAQIGYSYDSAGKSLADQAEVGWNDRWIVIATDQLGDPIFVDSSTGKLTVCSAQHGEGVWETYIISDSLSKFKNVISLLRELAIDRTNPVDIEKNPISDKDRAVFIGTVKQENPDAEIWHWEQFLE